MKDFMDLADGDGVVKTHVSRTLPESVGVIPTLGPRTSFFKRTIDVVLAISGLIALSPLLILVAVGVKATSKGPVLFRQGRYGLDRKRFSILKFRSMTVTESGDSARQATRGDARITKFGALIRRTSIDELPQLWNVVMGDMSLVGPRPHATAHDDLYEKRIANYNQRFRVRPGITGLAQVRGQRGATEADEIMAARVFSDNEYIENWSLKADIVIILRTVKLLFGDDRAY